MVRVAHVAAPLPFWVRLVLVCSLAVTTLARAAAGPAPRMLLLDGARAGAESIVVVGERGTISVSKDEGETWTAAVSSTPETLTGVAFADSRTGWVVGHGGVVLATHDGGTSWVRSLADEPVETSFLDVAVLDARTVIAVGAFGTLRTSHDGGATWTRPAVPENEPHLNRILVDPKGIVVVVGEAGTVLVSTDRGITWSARLDIESQASFYGVLALPEGGLIVHGLRGHVFRRSRAGAPWESVPLSHPVMFATSCRLDSGELLFAGAARWVFVSRDQGRSLQRLELPLVTAVAELIPLRHRQVLALGEAGVTRLSLPEGVKP